MTRATIFLENYKIINAFYLEYSFLPSLLLTAAPAKTGGGLSYMKPIPPPFLVRIPGGCPEVRMADMMMLS